MEKCLSQIINNNRFLTKQGKVADYIPALKKANADDVGLALVDSKGNVFRAGEYSVKFTMQSISKIISLIQAIVDNGQSKVFKKVGYQGTDEPFNSLYKLDLPYVDKPANPMINAGAIVTTSLIEGNEDQKFNKILALVRKMANNPNITYNREVYLSEKSTGDKNKAMAYLMKSRDMFEGSVEETLDTYFKQCSIEINAVDLAKIGLFIAQGCKGMNLPNHIDGRKISSIIIGIMASCGMYNFSSEYLIEVGIPSKSGVGGGIMGLLPNKCGIGVFSPALDDYGNSSAGYGIMKELSKKLQLNIF